MKFSILLSTGTCFSAAWNSECSAYDDRDISYSPRPLVPLSAVDGV
jgi:hypothetical protein